MSGRQPDKRSDYLHFSRITTRWMDNDVYGHVNNVVYYSFFDTVVNKFLMDGNSLDIARSEVVGLVVETRCQYFRPISFPDTVDAGIRVAKLGNSSVCYEVGLFRNDDDTAAAQGHFVHVYVDRASNRPAPIPEAARKLLSTLSHDAAG
ncbi:MAG: thioesterase family protein [Pseudorhodoplanes sp.]